MRLATFDSLKEITTMQVLLLKDVKGFGHAGDIKEVAGGYALNYLIPNKLAQQVTEGAVKQSKDLRDAAVRKNERKTQEAKSLANKLDGQVLTFKVRTGEGERLYGSITSADIVEALSKATGIEVERKYVELEHPIKTLGAHPITLKIASGLTATVTAIVEREA
jgi:large subunit ribosomal protein L9